MLENLRVKKYEGRITPVECLFSRSPFSIVTVVARIKGNVSENCWLVSQQRKIIANSDLFLLIVYGIGSSIIIYGLLRQLFWAPVAGLLLGLVLIGWIIG